MTEEKELQTFEELYQRDITKYVEKLEKKYKTKDGKERSFFLSYLSWAYGHREMKRIDPNATEHVHEFPFVANGQVIPGVTVPYLQTPQGFFVKSTVTINGRSETEWLPVLDNSNKPISNPTSFQINTSNKRCFVKALAKHGLGLYLYVGEDLPEKIAEAENIPQEKTEPKNKKPDEGQAVENMIKAYMGKLRAHNVDLKEIYAEIAEAEGKGNIKEVDNLKILGHMKAYLLSIENGNKEVKQESLLKDGTTTAKIWG